MAGKSDFLDQMDGSFFVTVEARPVAPRDVQNLLASFGELASFDSAGTDPHDQVRVVYGYVIIPTFTHGPCRLFMWTTTIVGTPIAHIRH